MLGLEPWALHTSLGKALYPLNCVSSPLVYFSYRLDDESVRDYRDRDRDYERDQERMIRERERMKRQEEERRRQQQKERYEKEKAFKRKEEEMKREKEMLRDKGKKSENTESICSLEKIEKKEEVVKRDRIRNKVLLVFFITLGCFYEDFFPCSYKYKLKGMCLSPRSLGIESLRAFSQ